MTAETPRIIQKEIERGEKALKASRLLLEQGLHEDTVSRAYYAVLHLAKAALLSQGVRTSSHKGIITQFGLHLVRKGLVDQELAKIKPAPLQACMPFSLPVCKFVRLPAC